MKAAAFLLSSLAIMLTACKTQNNRTDLMGIWTPTVEYRNQQHEEKRKENPYPSMELSVVIPYYEITENNGRSLIHVSTNVSDEILGTYELHTEGNRIIGTPPPNSKWKPVEIVIRGERHIDLIYSERTVNLTKVDSKGSKI